jgi:hypothetical protein
VLQTLILNRAPEITLKWADKVAKWDFQRVIPCHLDAPVSAGPRQFRQAFSFLEKYPAIGENFSEGRPLPKEDFGLLREIDELLNRGSITPPPKEKV